MDEKARITFLLLKILVSQCRKLLWASPQCFRAIGILKNSMLIKGYHVFPSKLFCLTVPKNFVGIPSSFQKIWGIEKFYALMGYHNFPSKDFCLTVPPKTFVGTCTYGVSQFLWASLQCFRTIGILKNSMHTRGYHVSPSKNFLVSQCRKNSWESLPFFRKVGVWASLQSFRFGVKFMHLWGITIFRRKILSHSAEKFRKGILSLQCFRTIGILKNSMHTRGYHVSQSKLFGLTVPKKFVGIPSNFQKSWGIGNRYALMGYHSFPSKKFVSQCRKIS